MLYYFFDFVNSTILVHDNVNTDWLIWFTRTEGLINIEHYYFNVHYNNFINENLKLEFLMKLLPFISEFTRKMKYTEVKNILNPQQLLVRISANFSLILFPLLILSSSFFLNRFCAATKKSANYSELNGSSSWSTQNH